MEKREKEKYANEKDKKIEKELAKIQYKLNIEMQGMILKIENHKNQLLRERDNKLYEIELKYKNKERELERKQKAERESFLRIISNKGKKKKLFKKYAKT